MQQSPTKPLKVKGRWVYFYRAIDKRGHTLDFYPSPTRKAKAAKRFLAKARNGLKVWGKPKPINTDKAAVYTVSHQRP